MSGQLPGDDHLSYRNNRTGKYSQAPQKKNRRGMPVWIVILLDALLTGAILLCFAFFHHVLPAMISEMERQQIQSNVETVETQSTLPPETEAPADLTEPSTEEGTEAPTEEQTEPPTEPDTRTPWQIKFAEHFSDEIVWTENSYKSPNVSITLETVSTGEGSNKQTYHVADIYIGSMDCFTAYTADNEIRYFGTQDVLEMSEAGQAIIAISGDFLTYQKGGFLIRNEQIYVETTNNVNICALFPDGTIETYDKKEYDIEEIKSRNPLQVWSFGPVLLDENGKVRDKYSMSTAVSYPNPRSAIGYYEPGHYCFVVVDGRQSGYAKGMSIPELAALFEELGCTKAYNLDGGGSAVMVFNHKRYSKQSNGGGRDLGDILLIREPVAAPAVKEAAQ